MREINEAWQVLQDPVRRRAYDDEVLGRRPPARTVPTTGRGAATRPVHPVSADDDLVDVAPEMGDFHAGLYRHLPWIVLVVVFGLIFVLSAYAGSDGGDQPGPTGPRAAATGDCIDVRSGPTTSIVPCSGPHELEIVDRVDEATACPAGTERRRLGADGLLDCVTPG